MWIKYQKERLNSPSESTNENRTPKSQRRCMMNVNIHLSLAFKEEKKKEAWMTLVGKYFYPTTEMGFKINDFK